MLKRFLYEIIDQRSLQGQRYELGKILFLSILSMLCGANSYRKIATMIEEKYEIFNKYLNLNWKKVPAYTTIRNIISSVSAKELEKAFLEYSLELTDARNNLENKVIAFDGKVLKGSFDNFKDQKAIQILSAFIVGENIILAHKDIPNKKSEIPAMIELIEELKLTNCLFTSDALHCQKKTINVIKETGNEAVLQVKENQPTLLNDCINNNA